MLGQAQISLCTLLLATSLSKGDFMKGMNQNGGNDGMILVNTHLASLA